MPSCLCAQLPVTSPSPENGPCALQDVWGWGASLLAPFAGGADPVSMFGLGEGAAPAEPAPEQGFFGVMPSVEPPKQPMGHSVPAPNQAAQQPMDPHGAQAGPPAASARSELVRRAETPRTPRCSLLSQACARVYGLRSEAAPQHSGLRSAAAPQRSG